MNNIVKLHDNSPQQPIFLLCYLKPPALVFIIFMRMTIFGSNKTFSNDDLRHFNPKIYVFVIFLYLVPF